MNRKARRLTAPGLFFSGGRWMRGGRALAGPVDESAPGGNWVGRGRSLAVAALLKSAWSQSDSGWCDHRRRPARLRAWDVVTAAAVPDSPPRTIARHAHCASQVSSVETSASGDAHRSLRQMLRGRGESRIAATAKSRGPRLPPLFNSCRSATVGRWRGRWMRVLPAETGFGGADG